MGEDFQKMQDSLKGKITERPDRETLVQQGILAGNKTCVWGLNRLTSKGFLAYTDVYLCRQGVIYLSSQHSRYLTV